MENSFSMGWSLKSLMQLTTDGSIWYIFIHQWPYVLLISLLEELTMLEKIYFESSTFLFLGKLTNNENWFEMNPKALK